MTERQINRFLRRRFSVVCWVLLCYYLLLNIMVSLTAVTDILRQLLWNTAVGSFLMDIDTDALMNNGWGYMAAICVGTVILHAWKGGDYWRQEVFAKEKKMTFLVLFCALSFCMGSQMLSVLWLTGLEMGMNHFGSSVMPILETVSGSTATFSMFLYSAFLAPVSEELLFRGYVLRSLRPYGKRFAILGSALLFGLFHGNLLQGPYAFLVGLILGYLACEYSIFWAIMLHIFNNLVLAEGLTRLTQNMPVEIAEGIHFALFGGFLVVSIGILIAKRRAFRAYRLGEWMDRRCVKCFLTNGGFLVLAAVMLINMAFMMVM